MKQFRQTILQVEFYSTILQIFKQSISQGTPFFESLAKKSPVSLDDMFKRADKYAMLKDDVRATSQLILVINRAKKNNKVRNSKLQTTNPDKVDEVKMDGSSSH